MSLELRSFSVTRNGFSVGPIDATVRPGSPLVVYGPNGSGKTTLLLGIAGFLNSTGSVLVNGEDVSGLPSNRRGIAYVPARPALPSRMSAREVAKLVGAKGAQEALRAIGLDGLWEEALGRLSFGQAKAVQSVIAISRGSAALLDEPFTGLSDSLASSLWGLVISAPKPVILTSASPISWAGGISSISLQGFILNRNI